MKKKINKKKLTETGKMNDSLLSHMRKVAYGVEASNHIWKTVDRSERMRNDEELLKAAEVKRQRKAMKRLENSK